MFQNLGLTIKSAGLKYRKRTSFKIAEFKAKKPVAAVFWQQQEIRAPKNS